MHPSLSPDMLALRRPALLFAPLAMAIALTLVLAAATWISGGFGPLNASAAQALAIPVGLGAILALASIIPRVRRGVLTSRRQLIALGAMAFAAAGFVWPLSFGIAVLLQGDAGTALASLAPALAGLIVGGITGALGTAVAAYACFNSGSRPHAEQV